MMTKTYWPTTLMTLTQVTIQHINSNNNNRCADIDCKACLAHRYPEHAKQTDECAAGIASQLTPQGSPTHLTLSLFFQQR